MRQHLAVSGAIAAILLSGCTGQNQPAAPAPASSAPATEPASADPTPSEAPSSPAAETAQPTPDGAPAATPSGAPAAPTDPTKLDGALLKPDQLPGWQHAENANEPIEAKADPAACDAIYQQTVGKVASDFGATAAYTKDSLFLQEFIDLVDNGTQSISDIEKTVAQCQNFSVNEGGEVTKFTATPMPVPALGDRSYAVRLGVDGPDKAELLYVWVAHKDTVMMLHIDGDDVDDKLLTDTATKATDTLKAGI